MNSKPTHRTGLVKIVGEYALDFTSAVYGDLLDALLPQVQSGDWHSNRLVVPFVLTCAAALEATLNDHLVASCFKNFPEEDYRRVSEAYLSMSFRGKLDMFVPTLTKGRFVVRFESLEYQSLSTLIKLRNELVHSKSFFVKAVKLSDDDQSKLIIDEKFLKEMDSRRLRSVTAKNCKLFFGAYRALHELFIYPLERDDLAPNAFVKYPR